MQEKPPEADEAQERLRQMLPLMAEAAAAPDLTQRQKLRDVLRVLLEVVGADGEKTEQYGELAVLLGLGVIALEQLDHGVTEAMVSPIGKSNSARVSRQLQDHVVAQAVAYLMRPGTATGLRSGLSRSDAIGELSKLTGIGRNQIKAYLASQYRMRKPGSTVEITTTIDNEDHFARALQFIRRRQQESTGR